MSSYGIAWFSWRNKFTAAFIWLRILEAN